MEKWDKRFLDLCEHVASWSKDPSTRVGSVIVNDNNQIVGIGYNGFSRGVSDEIERYNDKSTKYKFIVHAEANAILNANNSVKECTIYTSFFTCNECAKLIIQSGIKKVISYRPNPKSKWIESFNVAKKMYWESGVDVLFYTNTESQIPNDLLQIKENIKIKPQALPWKGEI